MKPGVPIVLIALVAVQLLCGVIFLLDMVTEFPGWALLDWHFWRETLATIALFAGVGFEIAYLRNLLRNKASLERSVGLASSALQDIVENHFAEWKLTASERDVAYLLVKGLSISEIAEVRGTAEGTVKAHLNAIYRKANARSRAEVMSTITDALVEKPLLAPPVGGRG
jgi:DNA-binding CsgD family transcriptional regulator